MLIKGLQRQLTVTNASPAQRLVWLGLSLAIALGFGIRVLQQAFSQPYIVQDDARQHLIWLTRFSDAELLPNDAIADYFQTIAPWGFAQFYRLFAALGVPPLLLSQLLPPILALLTTGYCFFLSLEFLPIPVTAFIATALFNQNFWMRDDLASASPRAFLNVCFLAFLYYLIRRSPLCLVEIVGIGWFYPQYVLVAGVILLLQLGATGRSKAVMESDGERTRTQLLLVLGLGLAIGVLLPYALGTSAFAPTITAAQARLLPEFAPTGRARFFYDDFGRYWLSGGRSGIQFPLDPPFLGLGLLLPLLRRFPNRFPLLHRTKHLVVLGQTTIAAFAMFFLAHALLFKLHLPSRYTQHSLRIVMAIASAIVLTALLEAVLRWADQTGAWKRFTAIGLTLLSALVLLAYPLTLSNFPKTTYVTGAAPEIYTFLRQQPKDAVVASLAEEANNLPIFGQRSILVGSEYAIPYHLGYYRPFRQRVLALLEAQYSLDRATVQAVIQNYGIDFWLLDRSALTHAYLAQNGWLRQYQPAYAAALAHLAQNQIPVLAQAIPRCTAMETEAFVLLNAACIVNSGAIAR